MYKHMKKNPGQLSSIVPTVVMSFLLMGGCSAPGNGSAEVIQPTDSLPSTPAAVDASKPTPEHQELATTGQQHDIASTTTVPDLPGEHVETKPTGLLPLTEEQRTLLAAGPEDAPLAVEIHYVQSNETRHDLFFPYIDGVGGAYVGVGSDQNFTMIGHARSDYAFLMDIDIRVVDLHRIYALLIPQATGPDEVIAFFHKDNLNSTVSLLEKGFASLPERERKRILRGFRGARETVYRHLLRVERRSPRNSEPSTWLSDPQKFAHIQKLHTQGRIRVLPGDLTGPNSLKTIARACSELGVEVTALYMSNAEEFFNYTPGFVENIKALPAGKEAVVLRTIYSKKWPHADLWSYQIQSLADLRTRLDDSRNSRRRHMLRHALNAGEIDKKSGPEGVTLLAVEPKVP